MFIKTAANILLFSVSTDRLGIYYLTAPVMHQKLRSSKQLTNGLSPTNYVKIKVCNLFIKLLEHIFLFRIMGKVKIHTQIHRNISCRFISQ